MDAKKTGTLIAQARRELEMTQRDLAERLHISDRAVSKWERGAGFPDVSLLEPLAEALSLTVADLLRGERTESAADSADLIRDAMKLATGQLWAAFRRNFAAILLGTAFLAFFLFPTGLWDRLWTRVTDIDCVVPAYLYNSQGERVGETQVEVVGEWRERRGEPGWYTGRFAIESVGKTCREEAQVQISQRRDDYGNLEAQEIMLYTPGNIDGETLRRPCYVAPGIQTFAVMTGEGTIIATDDYLAQLMALYPYAYRLDNVGITVWYD